MTKTYEIILRECMDSDYSPGILKVLYYKKVSASENDPSRKAIKTRELFREIKSKVEE